MKKLTLKTRLLTYLRRHEGFVAGGKLEELARGAGYTGSTSSRLCRRMTEEGLLEVKHGKKRHSWYRATAPKKTVVYTVPELDKKIISKEY